MSERRIDDGHTAPETGGRPLERLRALFDEGALAREYPTVPRLLSELAATAGAEELRKAGGLLARLDVDEVMTLHPGTATVGIGITGASTLDALVAPLTAELARHGVLVRPTISDFGAYQRVLSDPGHQFHADRPELVLCVLDPDMVFDRLPVTWGIPDLARETRAFAEEIEGLVARYLEHNTGSLVLNTLPLPRSWSHRLVDHGSRSELGVAWRELNIRLLKAAAGHDRVVMIDLDPLLAAGGPLRDPRFAVYAAVNLGDDLLAAYAGEITALVRALRGMTKKVLVVDLDNTLWHGVLGDDGEDGIAAASTLYGDAFGEFQRVVKQLGAQGVLLAVSSKNDEEPVLRVLRSHPDMVLRDDDFATINANWGPKDVNLRAIAEAIGVGSDSLVFADDSPAECDLVASALPEAAVVRLGEDPALFPDLLLDDGWFDCLRVTEADLGRTAAYRARAAGHDLRRSAGSVEEFLRRLSVSVTLTRSRAYEAERLSQLTLRTNQFNLTADRFQREEVKGRIADPGHVTVSVRAADRFGDQGLVGAIFARTIGDRLHVDNMLLSCRVFDRGVEQAAMGSLLAAAPRLGAIAVTGRYRPTERNRRFQDFYLDLGFHRTGGTESEAWFLHDLTTLPGLPTHVRITAELEETAK